jgi:hypothetical protein
MCLLAGKRNAESVARADWRTRMVALDVSATCDQARPRNSVSVRSLSPPESYAADPYRSRPTGTGRWRISDAVYCRSTDGVTLPLGTSLWTQVSIDQRAAPVTCRSCRQRATVPHARRSCFPIDCRRLHDNCVRCARFAANVDGNLLHAGGVMGKDLRPAVDSAATKRSSHIRVSTFRLGRRRTQQPSATATTWSEPRGACFT